MVLMPPSCLQPEFRTPWKVHWLECDSAYSPSLQPARSLCESQAFLVGSWDSCSATSARSAAFARLHAAKCRPCSEDLLLRGKAAGCRGARPNNACIAPTESCARRPSAAAISMARSSQDTSGCTGAPGRRDASAALISASRSSLDSSCVWGPSAAAISIGARSSQDTSGCTGAPRRRDTSAASRSAARSSLDVSSGRGAGEVGAYESGGGEDGTHGSAGAAASACSARSSSNKSSSSITKHV